ncbi:succinyldiaminopimelate transaminase [Aliarcobacter butzleri]|uniref:succinyldiaminopimelate transaminase n=1 Tax=Aliarcobacter butzleri TaxID=28197 RepID=UPI002B24D6D7|nr:succinyldiaminopimelate transaminase [Aliarcobacter butzleri]
MNFEKYPFEKLNELLKDIVPNEKYELSVLTIGEPKFETPQFIQDKLKETSSFLRKYPSTIGEPFLRESMINFVKNRFNVSLKMSQIIPTFGTREVLFNFPQFALFDKKNPVIAFTNPFYQIYEGAAIASRAEVIHINLTKENNFKANLSDEELKRCDLVILNFPNNPTSASMGVEELGLWVKKALEFDFILVNDECYSEIYFDENTKPASLLEASIKVGNSEFKNILVMNSISKRSSAPGLRSGFIAGDETILKDYLQYRTYIGCASPVPLQEAAAVAWNDQNHVAEFRKIYKRNFEIAQEILGIPTPEATFYIWLEVENDLEFTKKLYKEKNIKVLPGSFLGRGGLGKEYVRIALVENEEKTKESLKRLKDFIDE